LFETFISYLDCGKVKNGYNNASVYFTVTKFIDLEQKILPFFHKYSLLCNKNKDFIDFCKIISLVKSKSHLTHTGLNQIIEIKSGMNKGRNFLLDLEKVNNNYNLK
jgi:hypothetical protein